jgi:hypothetical protein
MKYALLAVGALLASSAGAGAVTITSGSLGGMPVQIDAGQFEALAPPTPSPSVTTAGGVPADGSRVIIKTPSDPVPDGRYNPDGGAWADSADLAKFAWNVSFDRPVRKFGFAVTDANDQPSSYWLLTVGDVTASIGPQIEREIGNIHWFTIAFGEAVESARLTFATRARDGFGLSTATIEPVPVPAAGLLLLGGLGALIAVRRLRRGPAG